MIYFPTNDKYLKILKILDFFKISFLDPIPKGFNWFFRLRFKRIL